MAGDPTASSLSREHTDASLQRERTRADEELLERSHALAEDADAVIARARERASRVLELARTREDAQLDRMGASTGARETVGDERRVADAELDSERTQADTARLDERERRRLAVLQLLALERETTDRSLQAERTNADHSVSAHEDILAVVSHDLKNLLNVLVINAATIAMSDELTKAIPLAHAIQKAGGQMNVLLEDLLDFSSMHAGRLIRRSARTDVVQLVRDAVAIHAPAAAANEIALTLQSAIEEGLLDADGRRLTRVVMNVLHNALEYTPSGGAIVVRIAAVADDFEISVADTGPGIPEGELESIFERYRQASLAKQRGAGVGLGLFIARAIVEAHGGRIWAENNASGGATFMIRLPRTAKN